MIDNIVFGISIFFLTFLIVFGILNRLNIFNSKLINYIISISISFYSLLAVNFFNVFSAFVSFLLLGILFTLFVVLIVLALIFLKKQK